MHTPKHILCTCHILQGCKNHLKIKRDSETEEKVYHTLKVLMDETEYKFKQIIEITVVQMKEETSTKEFGEITRSEQWAYSFRVSSRENTNTYLEAFHHIHF